jgi:hypothetical protein
MPLKPHLTDPDKMVYVKGEYTKLTPIQQNLPEATTALGTVVNPKRWVECAKCKKLSPLEEREWVGLTDEEVMREFWNFYPEEYALFTDVERAFYRAIEAKLKEKNT